MHVLVKSNLILDIVKEDRIMLRNFIKEFYQIDLNDYATNFQMSRCTGQNSSKFNRNNSIKNEISRKCLNRFQYSEKDMKWLQISLRKTLKTFKKQKYQEQVQRFKGWQNNKSMERLSRIKNKQIQNQKTSYYNSRVKKESLQKIYLKQKDIQKYSQDNKQKINLTFLNNYKSQSKNQYFSPKNIKSHRLSVNKFLQDYKNKHRHNYSNLTVSLQAKKQQNSFDSENNQSGRINTRGNGLGKQYKLISQKRYLLNRKNSPQSKKLSKEKNNSSLNNLNASRQKQKVISIKRNVKMSQKRKQEQGTNRNESKHSSGQIQEVIHQSSYKKKQGVYQNQRNSQNNMLNSTANFTFQKNSFNSLKFTNEEQKFNEFNRQNIYKKQSKMSVIPQKDLEWYHSSKKTNAKKSQIPHKQLNQKLKKYQQTSKYLQKILQGNQIQESQQKFNKRTTLTFLNLKYGDIPLTSSVNVSEQKLKDSQFLQKISFTNSPNLTDQTYNFKNERSEEDLFTKPQLLMECRKFINQSQMTKSYNSEACIGIDPLLSKNRSNIWISQDLQSQKNISGSKEFQNQFNFNLQKNYYLGQKNELNNQNIQQSPKKLHILRSPQKSKLYHKIETAKQFLQKYFNNHYTLNISEAIIQQMFSNLCQSLKPVIEDLLQQNGNFKFQNYKLKNILNFQQTCVFFTNNGLLSQLKESFSENIWKILNHTNNRQINEENVLIFLQAIEQAGLSQIYSQTKYLLEKIFQKANSLNRNSTFQNQNFQQKSQFMTKYNLYYLQLHRVPQILQLKRLLDPYDFSYQ